MAAAGEAHRDALLDSLGMVQAVLADDNAALTFLLDHCDQRAAASMMASLVAAWIRTGSMMHGTDPMATLGELRESLQGTCPP